MVPGLIWALTFFVPRNLDPKKFGPCMKMPHNDFHAVTNFLWDEVSRAQMRSGTISITAVALSYYVQLFQSEFGRTNRWQRNT